MHSLVEGFSPDRLPSWRSWDGMLADVWQVSGASGAHGEYVSPHARLFVVLDETVPRSLQLTLNPQEAPATSGRLSYIPPGVRTWSSLGETVGIRHLDLHVDLNYFAKRLGLPVDTPAAVTPRMMFDNDRIQALAQLLADECTGPGLHNLYGESIATALFVELFKLERQTPDTRGQLSPRRLRIATRYLEEHCLTTVRLQDLAELVALSPSYFNSAFKASTGSTPLQWQLRARIKWVEARMLEQAGSLSEIASAAGFADQAHMTRVFKQYAGVTPAAWLRRKVL